MSALAASRQIPTRRMIVLAAGGTGGHLFPAEAVARELLDRGRPVALVTDKRGANFPVAGVETFRIPAGRFGAGMARKIRGIAELAAGVMAATRLLGRLKPAAVIGFGGYPSMPTMMAAYRMGLPTIIHEQNAVLGRANGLLAKRVRRIATHFTRVEGLKTTGTTKLVHTGNPVRPAFSAIGEAAYAAPQEGDRFRILITGGSQGARILSQIVPAALATLPDALKSQLQISHQARPEDLDIVLAAYRVSGIDAVVRAFFDDIPARLAKAHLVICRSGGSTTAELTVAGRPAILVPYAAAIADEQTANARNLVDAGAAWLLREKDFTVKNLAALVTQLANAPAQLAQAAAAALKLGEPRAACNLADLVEQVAAESATGKKGR